MAFLYISEFYLVEDAGVPVPRTPSLADQTVVVGGSSVQSTILSGDTKLVRLHSDVICSIAFGTNPTATTSNARMAAGQTEYFEVQPGSKVAVISNT